MSVDIAIIYYSAHAQATRDIPQARIDDLAWTDAVLFGAPTRYGNMASRLKQFIDTTGPVWQRGLLADKVPSAFASAGTNHGGQERTLLPPCNICYQASGVVAMAGGLRQGREA